MILVFVGSWVILLRLVGTAGAMVVLRIKVFSLGLELPTRAEIPGAVCFLRVYDNRGNRILILPHRLLNLH